MGEEPVGVQGCVDRLVRRPRGCGGRGGGGVPAEPGEGAEDSNCDACTEDRVEEGVRTGACGRGFGGGGQKCGPCRGWWPAGPGCAAAGGPERAGSRVAITAGRKPETWVISPVAGGRSAGGGAACSASGGGGL